MQNTTNSFSANSFSGVATPLVPSQKSEAYKPTIADLGISSANISNHSADIVDRLGRLVRTYLSEKDEDSARSVSIPTPNYESNELSRILSLNTNTLRNLDQMSGLVLLLESVLLPDAAVPCKG